MIKLIVGKKGTGKTKALVDMINQAAESTKGNVVCIDKTTKLTYDINHNVRLCEVDVYNISGFDMFYGYVAGLLSSNYDISEIFVDSILRIGKGDHDLVGFAQLLKELEAILTDDITMIFTVSADKEALPEEIVKYVV